MNYIRNEKIDIMSLGDEEGTVLYDSSTENTFVLDEVSADVLLCFEKENNWDSAIDALSEMYGEERAAIEEDSKDFFEKLIHEGIV